MAQGFLRVLAIGPILASMSCVFKAPLEYPDVVFAGASMAGASSASSDQAIVSPFTLDLTLFSLKADRVAATGQGVVVLFDYINKRKVKDMPVDLQRAVRNLEAQATSRTDSDAESILTTAQALFSR